MNSITITGVEKALSAAAWCRQQKFKWDIDIPTFNTVAHYKFNFENSVEASYFALKWAGA